jgi:hypothetical protein
MAIDMRALAREGARLRLAKIAEEQHAITRLFPQLTNGTSARTTRGLSAAQRKAVGERMRKYWAKRRAEKAKQKD